MSKTSMTRDKYNNAYLDAYNTLNPEQKDAVDNIEGPVMVNAGPGTGKTQILATRIGNILRTQDVAPYNILCLTYTEAATVAMRKRLSKLIGPVSHQVHIHTFHGFCNQVIQENLDIFGQYKQLEPITDLESVDVFRKIIDEMDNNNPLKRFKLDRYFESGRMKNLFQLMKRESLTPSMMKDKVKEYLDDLPNRKEFIYSRKYTDKKTGKVYVKGDVKEKNVEKEAQKYKTLLAAIDQYDNFVRNMDHAERYDYDDMILWVIKHFQDNEDLLLQYQERYQYFLVDEFQDTNGSQNLLLEQLISYWDSPNVFVVGDDDQAIYKFQGANLGNILDFQKKYNPHTVVLKQNYRSNQKILDKATHLIQNNQERMVVQIEGLIKDLLAAGNHKDDPTMPEIRIYKKVSEEYADLVKQVKQLYDTDPEGLKNVAVIYRKHRQVEDLVAVLEKLNIPLNIKRRIDILKLPLVRNLLKILQYLSEEMHNYGDGQHRLFEILHYKYFGINPLDVGKMALYCQTKQEVPSSETEGETKTVYPKWREVISNKELLETLNLSDTATILETSALLDGMMSEIPIITLQTLFEKILNDGGVLEYIMISTEKSWLLQVVSTFFDLIKKETAKNPDLDLKSLLLMIKKMEDNKISLPINKTITSENGLNFLTAHSAKGLEFKKVYMIGGTEGMWDGKRKYSMGQYSFPDTINADNKNNIEDERRLFFVAMTRAETDLIISYSEANEEGKLLTPSQFVEELQVDERINVTTPTVDESDLAEFYYKLLQRQVKSIPLIETDLIDKWLEGYKLSVTHLNKYLKCPVRFYFESILKVPSARNASTGFGTAMHHALNKFFEKIADPEKRSVERLLFHFEDSMQRHKSHFAQDEYDNFLIHGQNTLKTIHSEKLEEWLSVPNYGLEAELSNAVYKGVPLVGFIDKVEIYKDHVTVVDYKTGSYKSDRLRQPSEKDANGGDYWRQIVFYKMLLDSDKKHGWVMSSGKIDYIEPDRKSGAFTTKEIAVSQEDMQFVGEQITETMEKIKAYEFDKTCEDKDCRWCNFVENNYVGKPRRADSRLNCEL